MKIQCRKAALILISVLLALVFRVSADDKIVPPVRDDSNLSQATFPASYDRVWNILAQILSDYQFEVKTKDKAAGRLETGVVVFSRNPHFSKLTTGVKAYSTPPKSFLHKWLDGRMRIRVLMTRMATNSTHVGVEIEIEGFETSVFDDSTVSGDWKECRSNGKFEFELLNDVATHLKRKSTQPLEEGSIPAAAPKSVSSKAVEKEKEDLANLMLQSVPEGAEIYLNGNLVGMTPSRLSLAAGEYKVLFRKESYKEFSRTLTILKRSDLTISSELEPLPPPQQQESAP
jgi:hypothetical protein